MSKSEAMRQAKISHIETGEKIHPFFWSPFILIGNNEFQWAVISEKWSVFTSKNSYWTDISISNKFEIWECEHPAHYTNNIVGKVGMISIEINYVNDESKLQKYQLNPSNFLG